MKQTSQPGGKKPSPGNTKNSNPKGKPSAAKAILAKPSPLDQASGFLGWIILAALAVLVFYPPYFQGLFFPRAMLGTEVYAGLILFLVCLHQWMRRDYSLLTDPMDWAILAYALSYALALFGAFDSYEAIYGLLKVLTYFMIFWMIRRMLPDARWIRRILIVIFAGACLVGVVGIGTATGLWEYNGSFVNGVIMSTLQYANATSAYMAVMAFIGVTLLTTERNFWTRLLYLTLSAMLILVSLSCASKGAWIVFLAGFLLLLLGMPGAHRLRSIFYLIAAVITAVMVSDRFLPLITSQTPDHQAALLSLLLLPAISLFWVFCWQALGRLEKRFGLTAMSIAASALVVLAVVAFFALVPNGIHLLVPESVTKELSGLSTGNIAGKASIMTRIELYRDALHIMADNPLGVGGGGWNLSYHEYQRYQYYSTEVHNYFLQIAVEAGILGLLSIISVFVVFFYFVFRLIRHYRQTGENQTDHALLWGMVTTILAMTLHAAFDFDFSIPSQQLLLFILISLVSFQHQTFTPLDFRAKFSSKWSLAAVYAASVVFISFSGIYLAAHNAMEQGLDLEKAKNYAGAQPYYEKSVKLNPDAAKYHAVLGAFYARVLVETGGSLDPSIQQQFAAGALREVQQAYQLSPHNYQFTTGAMNVAQTVGDIQSSMNYAQAAVRQNPWGLDGYNYIGAMQVRRAVNLARENKLEEASKDIAAAFALPDMIQAQAKKITPALLPFWEGPRLEPNYSTKLILVQAYYSIGDYTKALSILRELEGDPNAARMPDYYLGLAASLTKLGRVDEAQPIIDSFKSQGPRYYQTYELMVKQPVIPYKK